MTDNMPNWIIQYQDIHEFAGSSLEEVVALLLNTLKEDIFPHRGCSLGSLEEDISLYGEIDLWGPDHKKTTISFEWKINQIRVGTSDENWFHGFALGDRYRGRFFDNEINSQEDFVISITNALKKLESRSVAELKAKYKNLIFKNPFDKYQE